MTDLSEKANPRPRSAKGPKFRSSNDHLTPTIRARAQGFHWKRSYRIRVLLADTIAVVTAVTIASVGRFGIPRDAPNQVAWAPVTIYSFALVVIWLAALGVQHSRDLTLVGVGTEEYRL